MLKRFWHHLKTDDLFAMFVVAELIIFMGFVGIAAELLFFGICAPFSGGGVAC